jgi:hypothetical protein
MERFTPNMAPQDYKTYRVAMPKATHWENVSCEDDECPAYANGWRSVIDESNELGMQQAHYIRKLSGRGFVESRTPEGMTEFVFRPGQPCFTQHKARTELPEIFLVQGGDFRGNPMGVPTITHRRPELWVEDFAEHQDKLNTILERG